MIDDTVSPHPHRRYNVLTGDWVLVSPHRDRRPWHGSVETGNRDDVPVYDQQCFLCPGNRRSGGNKNPAYSGTFVFDNDFAALQADITHVTYNESDLLIAQTETGICRVICFTGQHDLSLAQLPLQDIRAVIDCWIAEYRELGARADVSYVQIFENKGDMMGCSSPHPHGQVWAQQTVPDEPARELASMRRHFVDTGRPLLLDYLQSELRLRERIVCQNDSFVVLVPFWAVWPYEVIILPRRQVTSLIELSKTEAADLASIVGEITIRYDNLFKVSFPYSAGIHQAPTDGSTYPECTLHMHFFPPLLRSGSVRKFMVGYEMLAGPQRDITPETGARRLRELPSIHYQRAGDA